MGANDIFKHILSIGYEFETHDLAKMSMMEDGTLVNSNTTLRNIKEKLQAEEAVLVDEHSYEIMEESGLLFREYFVEVDKEAGMDEEGEPNEVMHITNDRSNTEFAKMVTETCGSMDDTSKNDVYTFRTKDGRTFPISFTQEMAEADCGIFTGIEFVMTFYHPRPSRNIILETFLSACRKMLNHLDALVQIQGELFVKQEKVGILDERFLYHKKDTNLYYLETNDIQDTDDEMQLDKVGFVPQMTFRVSILHLLPVLRQLLFQGDYSRHRDLKKEIMEDYQSVKNVEDLVTNLLEGYNDVKGHWRIPLEKATGRAIFGYLFMIFYKIYMYVNAYLYRSEYNEENEEMYFKDYLCFASRHSNDVFYDKIKEILHRYFAPYLLKRPEAERDGLVISIIMNIVQQPAILSEYLIDKPNRNPASTNVAYGDPNYGDPSYSVVSYFQFFERPSRPTESSSVGGSNKANVNVNATLLVEGKKVYMPSVAKAEVYHSPSSEETNSIKSLKQSVSSRGNSLQGGEEREWFVFSETDVFTTMFDLPEDGSLLLENRLFFKEFSAFAESVIPKLTFFQYPSVRNYKRFYQAMTKKEDHTGKVWNPVTKRWIQQCREGYVRNSKFKCRFSRRLKKCKPGTVLNPRTKRCRKVKQR